MICVVSHIQGSLNVYLPKYLSHHHMWYTFEVFQNNINLIFLAFFDIEWFKKVSAENKTASSGS